MGVSTHAGKWRLIARREICKPEERNKEGEGREVGEKRGGMAGSGCFFYLTGHPGQVWVVKTLERQTVKKGPR